MDASDISPSVSAFKQDASLCFPLLKAFSSRVELKCWQTRVNGTQGGVAQLLEGESPTYEDQKYKSEPRIKQPATTHCRTFSQIKQLTMK